MTTPTREQVVQWFVALGLEPTPLNITSALPLVTLARADLEVELSEKDAEISKTVSQFLDLSAQICTLKRDVLRLQMALADSEALELGTSEKVSKLMNHIDDVNETICDPYRWCDDIDVLRKIEKLLLKGSQLIGDKL